MIDVSTQEERTFAELGMVFPLFAAPAKLACGYNEEATCLFCETEKHGFQLGIGDDIREACSRCGAICGIPVNSDATHTTCDSCRNLISVPEPYKHDPNVCYDCLRGGRASITRITEFGMVGWEQVVAGKTHGVPGLDPALRAQGLPTSDNEGWTEVHAAREWMEELTRTPTYLTCQQECWLFHCQRPMVYLGEWGEREFAAHAPSGDGKALFDQIVEEADDYLWEAMWQGKLHDDFGIYVFQCPTCQALRAHWDMF